jgi:hypothetical protein
MTILDDIKKMHERPFSMLSELKAPQFILDNERRLAIAPKVRGADQLGHLEIASREKRFGARVGRYQLYTTACGKRIALFRGTALVEFKPSGAAR